MGDSLAVRIPADVVRTLGLKEGDLGLKEGDNVELCALNDHQLAIVTEEQRRNEAIATLHRFRGCMPPDYKFDREEANAR